MRKADLERLYKKKENGVRGLIRLKFNYKTIRWLVSWLVGLPPINRFRVI